MNTHRFIKRSRFDADVDTLFNWHAGKGALERLVPPWDPLWVIKRQGGIQKGGTAVLKMKQGPMPYYWHALHTDFEQGKMFRDMQVKGPFREWIHTHRFYPDDQGANRKQPQSILEDCIDFSLPFPPLGDFFGYSFAMNKLRRIFHYRHTLLHRDLFLHRHLAAGRKLTFLISGSGGVIGSALVPFLTTGGHRVIRLVRRMPTPGEDEIFWDPQNGVLETHNLPPIDAVIHLGGENIGQGRWTKAKKKRIIESRTLSTQLLSQKICGMEPKPQIFLCASAIGYFGDQGDVCLLENNGPGNDFISVVCEQWEQSVSDVIAQDIRVVNLRIGIVLTPMGGALQSFVLPFKLGLGGRIGSGTQYMSWIGIHDVIGAIYHILFTPSLNGPVNITAPNPVTNSEFVQILGRVLRRPTLLVIPEKLILAAFGEMGREVLLSSTRVLPEKLINSGYRFFHTHLGTTLRHLLGLEQSESKRI